MEWMVGSMIHYNKLPHPTVRVGLNGIMERITHPKEGGHVRDTLKDERYFTELIDRYVLRIKGLKDKIESGQTAPDRIRPVMQAIYRVKLDIWQARYSKGDPVSELVEPFRELALDFVADFVPDWYTDSLWLLSVGVMLEVDDVVFNALAGTIMEKCDEDWLYYYLIHYRQPEVGYQESPLLWIKPYQVLQQMVEEAEDKPAAMLQYLKRSWYQAHRSTGWYNSHKSNLDIYTGYWSYESGAVAKVLGLDDSSLEGVQYYPYDLVHHKG